MGAMGRRLQLSDALSRTFTACAALFLTLALTGCASEEPAAIEAAPTPGEAAPILTPEETATEAPSEKAAAAGAAEPAAAADLAAITGDGVVEGQVVMATPGSSFSPAGVEVTLQGQTIDMETGALTTFLTRTTTTDADGAFRFEGLPMGQPHLFYAVSVVYNGVAFSTWAVVDASSSLLSIPLTLYENTTDPAAVTVDVLHVVLRRDSGVLVVYQIYVFSNHSDRIYVSAVEADDGRRVSVNVPLPPNAQDVIFDEDELGMRFVVVDGVIYDTEYVPPGQQSHIVSLSYVLPIDTREIALPIAYATARVNVLAEQGIRVNAPILTAAAPQTIAGISYDTYTGQNLLPGETLPLHIRVPGEGSDVALVILGVSAALAILGGGAYWAIRGRRRPTGLTPQQETLIRRMAELDEAFEAGHINRFDYEARRTDLKATLAEDFQND
jgi:hypothetical protein